MITQIPAKRQKLLRAGSVVKEPRKKAIASVIDVMVMEGPACVSPILNLSSANKCCGV